MITRDYILYLMKNYECYMQLYQSYEMIKTGENYNHTDDMNHIQPDFLWTIVECVICIQIQNSIAYQLRNSGFLQES
jgi:hypothetical protein